MMTSRLVVSAVLHWSPVSTTRVHGPTSRGRVDGPWTRVHFLTPELTIRVHGCQKMHPSWRAVNWGR